MTSGPRASHDPEESFPRSTLQSRFGSTRSFRGKEIADRLTGLERGRLNRLVIQANRVVLLNVIVRRDRGPAVFQRGSENLSLGLIAHGYHRVCMNR